MPPDVSIIVPNYNHSAFLPQRLSSIANQTFQDYEIILLDDCSSDNSDSLLRNCKQELPKVLTYVRNDKNSGSPFLQWIKGLEFARGKFVWIAESDDFATSDFLEVLVPALQNNPTCHLAACASVYTAADGSVGNSIGTYIPHSSYSLSDDVYRVSGKAFIWRYMQEANGLPNASALLARNTPLLRSSIPPSMRYCGDWVTWIRILANHDLIFCNKVMNHWRTHPQTTRWENQSSTANPHKNFWEIVHRPEYLREMLIAMLELRATAGRRWNTFVFQGMLEHYRKIAGDTAATAFISEMGWNARVHLYLKSRLQPTWGWLKQRLG